VEPKHRILTGDQLLFHRANALHMGRDVFLAVELCKTQIVLKMARFGAQQPSVEARQDGVEQGCKACKTLAGARLDEGADDQGVNQLPPGVLAQLITQPAGIARGTEMNVADAALGQQIHHLLEMQ